MADYVADIQKYTSSVNAAAVSRIVKFCGIALRGKDSQWVSTTDAAEVKRVVDGFCAKKLKLDAKAALAAIMAVGEKMKEEQTQAPRYGILSCRRAYEDTFHARLGCRYALLRRGGCSAVLFWIRESASLAPMRQYLDLMRHVRDHGTPKNDRTGTGTRSVFGYQMRFDLAGGFPLVTTKKMHLRSIIYELLWLLSGDTNIKFLHDNKVTIWDEWADANGDLGPVYGQQWRSWPSRDGGVIDQIADTVERIKKTPDSRRLLVTAWNPADVDKMALPPCHCLFQFYVANGKLSCQLYQRSADIFLGVPFNIASYAMLTHMMAHVTGLKAGEFVHTLGDAHIYLNHLEQIDEQLSRTPYALPRLVMKRDVKAIDEFRYEDFEIVNYQTHPHISAPVAV